MGARGALLRGVSIAFALCLVVGAPEQQARARGQDGARSASSTAEIPVPWHRQRGTTCVQASMQMVMGWQMPDATPSLAELDRRTGREEGQWTWMAQALPVLLEEGLDCVYYSTCPYEDLTRETCVRIYGEETARVLIPVTNWEVLGRATRVMIETGRFERRRLPWEDLLQDVRDEHPAILIIDRAVLEGHEEEPYLGHAVVLVGVDDAAGEVVFHDPARGPSLRCDAAGMLRAWDAPGTDNDVIVVRGPLEREPR